MNLSTEANEQGVARRGSSASAGSVPPISSNAPAPAKANSDDDNPLMRLVDAALAPDQKQQEARASAADEKQAEDPSKKEPEDASRPTPSLQEAKVIKGSVHDLVHPQEKKQTFAEYLMEVLNNEANHDVLQWMPCGTQFTITNHRKFTMERMPELFKIRNMSSFVRKLTRWGFSRVHEKETGNSDIFKHPNFQRDKPELCKKIRCVNRATASNSAHLHQHLHQLHRRPGDLMGNLSEHSSTRPVSLGEMHLMSPERRGMTSPGYHRSPPHAAYGRPYPRVSPEYEKEMMTQSAFRHPQHQAAGRPGAPQVYSPNGGMSAAAEYELEQILLQRQQARVAAYRQQQAHPRGSSAPSPPQQQKQGGGGVPMGSASERSMGSGSDRSRGDPTANSQAVAAALESLQRDGEYDLDMSPREAMLRAVLHKRQQQRAAARALQAQQQGRPVPPGASAAYHQHPHHAAGDPPPRAVRTTGSRASETRFCA